MLGHTHRERLTESSGEARRSGVVLEHGLAGQFVRQLAVAVLGFEDLILEVYLRLKLGNLLLQLPLGSLVVLARAHHSRWRCRASCAHVVHLLRVSDEQRTQVEITLQIDGLLAGSILLVPAVSQTWQVCTVRLAAQLPSLYILGLRIPPLLRELEVVRRARHLTARVLRLEEGRPATLARSFRRIADPRWIWPVAPHQLADYL